MLSKQIEFQYSTQITHSLQKHILNTCMVSTSNQNALAQFTNTGKLKGWSSSFND